MDDGDTARDLGVPDPSLAEGVLRFVPLLENYYRRAHEDMPDELRDLFRRHHLAGRHGAVLVQLVSGGEITVGSLSERLNVHLSTTSELVADLTWVGLTERRRDPSDRRRVLVSLADAYRPLMERFVANRAAPLLRVLAHLSPEELKGFAAGLEFWAAEVS
ncbi:MarR family winged helix-turn-helix transcriptional regulator [Nocardiopsis coralliicola]